MKMDASTYVSPRRLPHGKNPIAHGFTRMQARYRRAGIDPTWETYINSDAWKENAGLAPEEKIAELHALWDLCLEVCPNRLDQRGLSYALAVMALPNVRNFAAFKLKAEEAARVEEAVAKYFP